MRFNYYNTYTNRVDDWFYIWRGLKMVVAKGTCSFNKYMKHSSFITYEFIPFDGLVYYYIDIWFSFSMEVYLHCFIRWHFFSLSILNFWAEKWKKNHLFHAVFRLFVQYSEMVSMQKVCLLLAVHCMLRSWRKSIMFVFCIPQHANYTIAERVCVQIEIICKYKVHTRQVIKSIFHFAILCDACKV